MIHFHLFGVDGTSFKYKMTHGTVVSNDYSQCQTHLLDGNTLLIKVLKGLKVTCLLASFGYLTISNTAKWCDDKAVFND